MQLKRIAVNVKGWAVDEPLPNHPEGQKMYVKLTGSHYDLLARWRKRRGVLKSDLVRQSIDLRPEEMGEVSVTETSIPEVVIVGYALRESGRALTRRNPHIRRPIGTAVPPNILARDNITELLLAVCQLKHYELKEPIYYVVMESGPGRRQAYRMPTSRVFFRHEFRGNELNSRESWMRNIVNCCNAIVCSSSDFETDRSTSGRTAPSGTPSEADDDDPPRSALATFFDGDSKITKMEAEEIINELITSQSWEPTYTIDSKEVRLLHQAFLGADITIANNNESRVKFFINAAKRMKTLKSEQQQVNEILVDTMREVRTQEMAKDATSMQNTMGQIAQALEGVQTQFRDDTMGNFEEHWMQFVLDFQQKSAVCLEALKSLQETTENLEE